MLMLLFCILILHIHFAAHQTAKRLGFVHTGSLKMSDDVLCVKYSPDQKLIAVSLLDCTVKVGGHAVILVMMRRVAWLWA